MYANFGIVHNNLIFSALLFMFIWISFIIPYVSVTFNYNVSKSKKTLLRKFLRISIKVRNTGNTQKKSRGRGQTIVWPSLIGVGGEGGAKFEL